MPDTLNFKSTYFLLRFFSGDYFKPSADELILGIKMREKFPYTS